MKGKSILIIELAILVLGILGALAFDKSLTLGKFHGFVFYLYSIYYSTLFIIVNLVLYFVFRFKKSKNAGIFLKAAFLGIATLILLIISSSIMQS